MRLIVLCCALLVCNVVLAEYAVIVHPSNQSSLSALDIRRIYLAKVKQFPDGEMVQAIDRPEGTDIRSAFVQYFLHTDEQRLRAYLARLLFTGKVILPKILSHDEDVVNAVANNPGTIAFVEAGFVDPQRVRVVATF